HRFRHAARARHRALLVRAPAREGRRLLPRRQRKRVHCDWLEGAGEIPRPQQAHQPRSRPPPGRLGNLMLRPFYPTMKILERLEDYTLDRLAVVRGEDGLELHGWFGGTECLLD